MTAAAQRPADDGWFAGRGGETRDAAAAHREIPVRLTVPLLSERNEHLDEIELELIARVDQTKIRGSVVCSTTFEYGGHEYDVDFPLPAEALQETSLTVAHWGVQVAPSAVTESEVVGPNGTRMTVRSCRYSTNGDALVESESVHSDGSVKRSAYRLTTGKASSMTGGSE